MWVIHDKCGNPLVNAGELLFMLKGNIYYWPLLSQATVKNDKCKKGLESAQFPDLVET